MKCERIALLIFMQIFRESARVVTSPNFSKVLWGSPKASHIKASSEPPGSYELSASRSCFKRKSQESSYEPGGSDVVRELSREPAMLQIGL